MSKKIICGGLDRLKASGLVSVCLRGPDGKIKDRVVVPVPNLVVLAGRQHIAGQLANDGNPSMSHMAIGTGVTLQAEADTVLVSELSRKAFTSKAQGTGAEAYKIIYISEWVPGEGTGAITEAGIFNASTGGTMLARTTFGVKNKEPGDSLTLTWTISING